MICHRFCVRFQNSPAIAAGLLAVTLAAVLASAAFADTSPDSFSVRLSEKQGALQSDADSMMSYMSRDLGFDRMLSRNRPYLELTNNSTSQDPITDFHLALGDSRFNFDCAALGACAVASKTSTVDLVSSQSDGGDQLDINFPDGLAPGATVRFRIALGFDAQYKGDKDYFATPDFRTVLFHMDGGDFYPINAPSSGSGDAEMTVNFGALTAGPVSFDSLDNFPVSPFAGRYYNNIYHAYGATDPVQVFEGLSGSVAAGVPEPSTAVLAAAGLLIGLIPAVRRYRRG
ncbi:MAG TPA: hypothetical protein VGM76_07575 [Lacipirellulaceae bacterium]|jgi:hypothetical protein